MTKYQPALLAAHITDLFKAFNIKSLNSRQIYTLSKNFNVLALADLFRCTREELASSIGRSLAYPLYKELRSAKATSYTKFITAWGVSGLGAKQITRLVTNMTLDQLLDATDSTLKPWLNAPTRQAVLLYLEAHKAQVIALVNAGVHWRKLLAPQTEESRGLLVLSEESYNYHNIVKFTRRGWEIRHTPKHGCTLAYTKPASGAKLAKSKALGLPCFIID